MSADGRRRVRRAARRGASYVEILVIVGVVLVLGALGLQWIGLGSSEHAGKEAACMQSFSCADGASRQVALPDPHGGDHDHDHDDTVRPVLWGSTTESLERWRTEAQGRYSPSWVGSFLASRIVPVPPAGSDPSVIAAREYVINELARLPNDVLMALWRDGLEVRMAPNKIETALPENLRNYHPPAYPPGVNLGDARGVYLHRETNRPPMVIIAVDSNGRPFSGGSLNVLFHEIGHAYDYTRANGRSSMDDFNRARDADRRAGGITDGYYLTTQEGGRQTSINSARAETYAEAFDWYYRDGPGFRERSPNLYNYFRARDTRAWAWERGWAWYNAP